MRPWIVLLVVVSVSVLANGQSIEASETPSRLRNIIERFEQDSGALNRFYSAAMSANRSARLKALHSEYLSELARTNFDLLSHDEQVDYILFRNYLDHEEKELVRSEAQFAEMVGLIPFAKTISDLEDARRRLV